MAEEPGARESSAPAADSGAQGPARSKDEVALELMKFIAVATGYGKGSTAGAGFSGKPSTRTAEEHAEALLQLFERCRSAVNQGGAKT